jgi:hypothetical protein
MLDDIRNHQPQPTAEECRWISVNPFAGALRVAIFALIAVSIGSSASLWLDANPPAATLAKAGR